MSEQTSGAPQRFRSKRDPLIVCALWLGVFAAATSCVVVGTETSQLALRASIALGCGLLIVFLLWTMYGTEYAFEADALKIRCGPLEMHAVYAHIHSVTPTRNPFSGPALSFDRLEIQRTTSRFELRISPENREAFLRRLTLACPHLRREGDALVARDAS